MQRLPMSLWLLKMPLGKYYFKQFMSHFPLSQGSMNRVSLFQRENTSLMEALIGNRLKLWLAPHVHHSCSKYHFSSRGQLCRLLGRHSPELPSLMMHYSDKNGLGQVALAFLFPGTRIQVAAETGQSRSSKGAGCSSFDSTVHSTVSPQLDSWKSTDKLGHDLIAEEAMVCSWTRHLALACGLNPSGTAWGAHPQRILMPLWSLSEPKAGSWAAP